MKIKLDENLHTDLVEVLTAAGHDVDTVADEGLLGADDATVSATASADDRLVLTLDRGFGDLRLYPPGTHGGILVLRLDDHSFSAARAAIARLVEDSALEGLVGSVAIYRNGALRVRRPRVD